MTMMISSMISSHKFKVLLHMWLVQVSVVLVVSAVGLLLGCRAAVSVILGGLIYIIPNSYLAVQTFRATGARKAAQVMGNIYRGECGKFVLTAIGFAAVFVSGYPINAPMLFIIYIVLVVLQVYQVSQAQKLNQY